MRICSVEGCDRKHHGRGYCSIHLHKFNRLNGLEDSPEKSIWYTMKARCYNPNNHKYARYGGRGIKVCNRWLESFDNFYADMGAKPSPQHSIDRIDNNGNYEPTNCKWATHKEQGNNTNNNFLITIDGKTKTLGEWCDQYGVPYKTMWARIKTTKMSPLQALTSPIPLDTCKHGHELIGDNLRINPKTGQRVCRTCCRQRMIKFKQRKLEYGRA